MSLDIQPHHIATARRNLASALHYHRFFGQPCNDFSPGFNLPRAEANQRTVQCYARVAGEYAFYSGLSLVSWELRAPSAAVLTDEVWQPFVAGYEAAAVLLGQRGLGASSKEVQP